METKKLLSWNVNGIRAAEKKGLIDYIRNSEAFVVALQETKAQRDQLSEELLNIDGYESWFVSAEKKGYSGVALYARQAPRAVHTGLGIEEFDREGRVITADFGDFYLINAYFPNAQHELLRLEFKRAFNAAMRDYCIDLAREKTVVLCGDYNVAHKEIDLKNPANNRENPGFTPEERADMDAFIAAGFIDTFRLFNQEPDNYTWWSYRFGARKRNIGWRIDYFCVDEKSRSRIEDARIYSDVMGSDHCPVGLFLT
jgi:exodeoxyribonuclease-3